MLRYDQKPDTKINFGATNVLDRITNADYSCFIGPNNSGKSFVLKNLILSIGDTATYLRPARYNNFNSLSPYSPRPNRRSQQYQQFAKQFYDANQNLDNSPFNIQQAIAELDDKHRIRLFGIVEKVLGAKLSLELAFPENDMSQRYISCDGHNFSFASSGIRLVVSIITSLLDTEYTHFLVDEPELGVSPKAQGQLADFLFDKRNRSENFPHIKSLIFATHSSLFLDRKNIENNYVITRDSNIINVRKLKSLSEFNQVHFFLLGNRLESLFLPSLILFVEGLCEEIFLTRVLEAKYPDLSVSIINATNDSETKRYAHMLSQLFPNIQHSPYKDRVIPILDSIHGTGIISTLKKKGISEDHIVTWSQNGIEHYYPEEIMSEVFGGIGPLSISADEVTMCGTTHRKYELAKKVSAKLTKDTKYPDEVDQKLFRLIESLDVS